MTTAPFNKPAPYTNMISQLRGNFVCFCCSPGNIVAEQRVKATTYNRTQKHANRAAHRPKHCCYIKLCLRRPHTHMFATHVRMRKCRERKNTTHPRELCIHAVDVVVAVVARGMGQRHFNRRCLFQQSCSVSCDTVVCVVQRQTEALTEVDITRANVAFISIFNTLAANANIRFV